MYTLPPFAIAVTITIMHRAAKRTRVGALRANFDNPPEDTIDNDETEDGHSLLGDYCVESPRAKIVLYQV